MCVCVCVCVCVCIILIAVIVHVCELVCVSKSNVKFSKFMTLDVYQFTVITVCRESSKF